VYKVPGDNMKHKCKERCKLEICSKCKEISDLDGKKICYWCVLESETRGQDLYDLPEYKRESIEEEADDSVS
jgi:hypothetical protein